MWILFYFVFEHTGVLLHWAHVLVKQFYTSSWKHAVSSESINTMEMVMSRSSKKVNPRELSESLDSAIKELEKHNSIDTKFSTLEEQLKITGMMLIML